MPGIQDMIWYLVVLTFASLNLFALYSLYLKLDHKKTNTAKIVFIVFSIVVMVIFCLWLKEKNDEIWREFMEYVKIQTRR